MAQEVKDAIGPAWGLALCLGIMNGGRQEKKKAWPHREL